MSAIYIPLIISIAEFNSTLVIVEGYIYFLKNPHLSINTNKLFYMLMFLLYIVYYKLYIYYGMYSMKVLFHNIAIQYI